MKDVNVETVTDTESWYKIQPLHGYNHTVVKLKLHMYQKGVYESFSNRRKKKKTDNSMEFGKPHEELSWNHCTSTPHQSETNGIAERAVRRIKGGTSAVLLQSGLDEKGWADSMECCCYLRCVQDLLSDAKTPCERRFGEPFRGPVIPFGSVIEYQPICVRDQLRLHQFGKNVSRGIFLGYGLFMGRIGKGDILVADIEELANLDASETGARRLDAKEVIMPKNGEHFIFPMTNGTD